MKLFGTRVAAAQGGAGTQVSTCAGYLSHVTINTKGASSNVLTLYDYSGSGGSVCSVLAVIDTTASVGTLYYQFDFVRGLLAYSNTGTGADYTIVRGQ